jgi:hypothetical protein
MFSRWGHWRETLRLSLLIGEECNGD